MAISAVLWYVIDTTALPLHITGLLPWVTGFHGMFGYIFTVCNISWHLMCESLHVVTRFKIPIWTPTRCCSHIQTISHNYELYQRNQVIDHDRCYVFGVEFNLLSIYIKLDSSTTPTRALAYPAKQSWTSTVWQCPRPVFQLEHMLGVRVVDPRHMLIN